MNRLLIIACVVMSLGLAVTAFPNGAVSVLLIYFLSIVGIFLIRFFAPDDKEFLINIFLVALLARVAFGIMIYIFDLQLFFGADATLYDAVGQRLVEMWSGQSVENDFLTQRASSTTDVGWGMNYLVGIIYFITGKSILIAQSFCAVIGAATAPMVYFCAKSIYNNTRVAKISAISIALFPSFIIWSGQLMKDGLIIFLLVCTMTMVLQLQKKFNIGAVAFLIFSLFGIISLRFYIFYMLAVAVAGSFVIGLGSSSQSIVRRVIVVVLIGLSLTYLGILRNSGTELERYANLEQINISRTDLAKSADSGFGEDLDVSTTEGAIAAIPIGFLYLMLAPFPWQIGNFRQAITLPEILLWWALIPLIFSGIVYTVKNRLREAIPILLFSLMLSLAYSLFQGNVGTAYRQRTQIQVFLFMFIAVGWTLLQERKENRKMLRQIERERASKRIGEPGS